MEAIHLFNAVDRIVAARIAAAHDIDPETMYIERGALFYRRNGALRCWCQVDSDYWLEMRQIILAELAAAEVIKRVKAQLR